MIQFIKKGDKQMDKQFGIALIF